MTDGAEHSAHHPPHGSIGEEAVKLAEAVQEWLGDRTGRGAADAWAAATAPGAFEAPECRVCPVCRAMHFVHNLQPDVFAHLADAAASLSAAVRAMGETGGHEPAGPERRAPEATAADVEPSGEA